ncbi:uncharacterized protein [Atheta coriaria]|uniref:uncharacterized protein n=1 Tax=Dalotia coriaria TaxID=877792 RepID=UPI0031F47389
MRPSPPPPLLSKRGQRNASFAAPVRKVRARTTARTSFINSLKQSFCRGHDESLLVHDMDVADKSVATDDLPAAVYDTRAEVARLEAVLNSLVEQKVDAMKHSASGRKFIRAVSSASPKTLAKRLRIASLSTSIADRDRERDESTRYSKRKRRRHQKAHKGGGRISQLRTPERQRPPIPLPTAAVTHSTLADVDDVYLQYDPAAGGSCCCADHSQTDLRIPVSCDDDYVSLKIDDCDDIIYDEEDEYEARRRRRKRRKRRRKRRKLRAMAAVAIVEEVRAIDPDELPPKARWTIIATAGLLLFMCLMLVGVTLRMAPLIDDMVRKENEALRHSLHGNTTFTIADMSSTP